MRLKFWSKHLQSKEFPVPVPANAIGTCNSTGRPNCPVRNPTNSVLNFPDLYAIKIHSIGGLYRASANIHETKPRHNKFWPQHYFIV